MKFWKRTSLALSMFSSGLFALSIDGEGHYALRGETRMSPGASDKRGTHQATDQSFRLLGEGRFNDRSSMFLEFRLFDDGRRAFLGDTPEPEVCEKGRGADCIGAPQNVLAPGYKPYTPRIHKAYARYAMDYCIIEAGRRPRSWGLGIFLDGGDKPFDTSESVFDGILCDVNIQKSQTLGVRFGYDKLAETGASIFPKDAGVGMTFGPSKSGDDVGQIFVALELDDRKVNAGSSFTKHVGLYASRIDSGRIVDGGLNTDLTFVDIFTGFYFGHMSLQSELLMRFGKTADPSMVRYGGARFDRTDPATNRMNGIAALTQFEWIFSRSGEASKGLYEDRLMNHHALTLGFGFAPGDSQGYFSANDEVEALDDEAKTRAKAIGRQKRSATAGALAFHQNYSPGLILFNGRQEIDDLAVDGIFEPSQMMNAQIFQAGYRFEHADFGRLESNLTYASFIEEMPGDAYDYYSTQATRPMGYYGTDLGFELDVIYSNRFSREMSFAAGLGYLIPGDAWKRGDESPKAEVLLQSSLTFHF